MASTEIGCDIADRCVFDTQCLNYLNCSVADPKGLEIAEIEDRLTALETRFAELKKAETDGE